MSRFGGVLNERVKRCASRHQLECLFTFQSVEVLIILQMKEKRCHFLSTATAADWFNDTDGWKEEKDWLAIVSNFASASLLGTMCLVLSPHRSYYLRKEEKMNTVEWQPY